MKRASLGELGMIKKTFIVPVYTAALMLILSGCAGKTAVSETPADQAPAETTAPAADQASGETKDKGKTVEVIPLDASLAEPPTAAGADSTAAAPGGDQAASKNEAAATAAHGSPSTMDISGITNKMLDVKYTLWHSRDKTYRLYVGEQFEAEYSPGDKTLLVKSDEPGTNLQCKYTMDGKLDPQQNAQGKACTTLTQKLEKYVSNN
jgi:hypothetical protein